MKNAMPVRVGSCIVKVVTPLMVSGCQEKLCAEVTVPDGRKIFFFEAVKVQKASVLEPKVATGSSVVINEKGNKIDIA